MNPIESQTDKRRLTAAEKQAEALRLRTAGVPFAEIARRLGYRGESGAHKAVMTGLKKTLQEPADELRIMEAERLDRMLAGLWDKAITGDTWSVDRVLSIMERRARLLGLDTPPRHDPSDEMAAFLAGVNTVKQMAPADLSE